MKVKSTEGQKIGRGGKKLQISNTKNRIYVKHYRGNKEELKQKRTKAIKQKKSTRDMCKDRKAEIGKGRQNKKKKRLTENFLYKNPSTTLE